MKDLLKALLLVFCCLSHAVHAAVLEVCSTCSFHRIADAVAAALPYDHISVLPGTYYENNIRVDKPLDIIGKNFPIVDGDNRGEIFYVTADDVKIAGLQIQNVGVSYTADWAAIKINKSSRVIIANNKLINTFFGIYLANASDAIISGNQISGTPRAEHNSGNAIHLWYCRNMHVERNISRGHRDGIYLEFVSNSCMEENYVEGNIRYGLHFMFSDNNEYRNNTFRSNHAGVAVMYSSFILMTGNRFMDNWGAASYGLLLKDIRDSNIHHNVFSGNTVGIFAEGTARLHIRANNFIKNGWAMKIMSNCEQMLLTENNFISNSFELTTNSNTNYNRYERNFWSKYQGYDLNKDGVGDVPHNPVDLFTFLVERQPCSIILMRSLFIDLLNLSERINPMLTPSALKDDKPLMKPATW
ncbi:MAG: copper ABC transporter substrate-binding protein [Chitinophagales bacterium]|nr:MAG: copper ABC transporter substrate-binding protein [Chitinophagales bacterium]